LGQAAFDRLLSWLDPDRERAGEKYEQIRARLIKIFQSRGCQTSEELADDTINRVTRKVANIADGYQGDPALYFYGVAQKVFLEYVTRKPPPPPPPRLDQEEDLNEEYECLEQCLERLSPRSRELILLYYQRDKQAKIDSRKELAARLGIASNALKIRALRVRNRLRDCVTQCLNKRGSE